MNSNCDICECIKDWPLHNLKIGDLLECKIYYFRANFVKYPDTGWQLIGDRKFKRYFKAAD